MNKGFKEKVYLILIAALALFAVFHIDRLFAYAAAFYDVFSTIILGGMMAFVLNVPMSILEKKFHKWDKKERLSKGFKRVLALISVLILLIGILIGTIAVVYPTLSQTARQLIEVANTQMPSWLETLQTQYQIDISYVQNLLKSVDFQNVAGNVSVFLLGLTRTLSSVFSGVLNVLLGMVFAIYMLMSKEQLASQTKRLMKAFLPEKWSDYLLYVGNLVNRTYSQFLSGQCVEALIIVVLVSGLLLAFQIPYAVMTGVLAGVLSFIPYVGPFIACGLGALFILVTNPWLALVQVVLFLIAQQIEGQFIYPRVVGQSVGLPALYTLAAALIGGNLFGLVGMIFFTPLVAVIYQLLKEATHQRLARKETF